MHSADRRYWWDGGEWQLAVSPDGSQWFDGTRWVPNPLAPPPARYLPTRWTRPLQVAVIAVTVMGFVTFLWTAVLVASTPPSFVVVSGGMSHDEAARLAQSFRPSTIAATVVNGVFLLALVTIIVLGALKRWRWMFWVTLVGFGLLVVFLLVGLAASALVQVPRPPAGVRPSAPSIPSAVAIAGLLEPPAALLLFICMLVVAIRIGPWACRKTTVERPDLQPPTAG